MRKIKNKTGLSLIEVIVAAVLLSLVIGGFAATFLWVANTTSGLERRMQAVKFAQDILEQLLIKEYDNADLDPGSYSETTKTFLALPLDAALKTNFSASRSYSVEQIGEGKKISVNVTWKENNKQKIESLFGLLIQL